MKKIYLSVFIIGFMLNVAFAGEALNLTKSPNSKVIMLFYSPGCNDCKEIRNKFLPELIEKYGNKIWIEEYDIDNPESFAVLLDLQNKYDKRAKKGFFNPSPPAVFAEHKLLYGVKDIKNKLPKLLRLK